MSKPKPCVVRTVLLFACLALLALDAGAAPAPTKPQPQWPRFAASADNVPISYEVHGSGEPTLVFVHGWCADSRYWRFQVREFSKRYRVVVLDLAGHGHSGATRSTYSMRSFGEDVRAVTEAAGGGKVILIGHSMGGAVIAEAALLLPGRVIGLIGVDTLENVEYPMTDEERRKMIEPMEKDFRAGSRKFVGEMFSPKTDPKLREWILSDISAALPAVALSAINEMMGQYVTGEAARIFDRIQAPVVAVGGDLWPIDYAANRRHMASYEAIVLKGADHFLMLDRPVEFNRALGKAVRRLSGGK